VLVVMWEAKAYVGMWVVHGVDRAERHFAWRYYL
jgi:hypothetical protein